MKRSTLLRKVIEPAYHGRVFDMECECVKWYCDPDGWYSEAERDCPKCHGSGRVSNRLSRREAHAVVTYFTQQDKAAKRATEEMRKDMLLRLRREVKEAKDFTEWRW